MEWNSARLKWPLLSQPAQDEEGPAKENFVSETPVLAGASFSQLCRVGFALTWPVVLVVLALIGVLLFR